MFCGGTRGNVVPHQSYSKIVRCKMSHQKHSTLLHPKNEKIVKTKRASLFQTQSNNTENKNQKGKPRSCFTEVVAGEGMCSATGAGASAIGLAIVSVNVAAISFSLCVLFVLYVNVFLPHYARLFLLAFNYF